MKKTEVIHFAYANQYNGVREDGRRVAMVPIACQETRVSLPKGHGVSWASTKVNCRVCIEKLIRSYEEELTDLKERQATAIDSSDVKFLISKRERGNRLLAQWFKHGRPDTETLERIRRG